MKTILSTCLALVILVSLSSCLTGNYVSRPTGETKVTQAPMKLKLLRKARWTYYAYTNSAAFLYYENARYKKKGDTIYMRARTFYGDTNVIEKKFIPQYVVSGDTLKSIYFDVAYIKESKASE